MSGLAGATQDAPQVFADGLRVHFEEIHGNGVDRPTLQSKELIARLPRSEEISDEAVRKELECILDSREFKDKPMLRGFLTFVVGETLAGRSHEIKGYTVATQVFGRRHDFDPTIDPIVRIQAGRLRRILESYYLGQGSRDQLRIEIGKGSYIPIFSRFIPEKPRLVQSDLSGAMLPYKVRVSQDAVEPIPVSSKTGTASVAVMPLVNLTNDPDTGYMADGLTEELMIELARCPALQVNASHSATQWKEKRIGVREIGLKLGVRFLLEGSLRKEGQTVKFTLRLIDTITGMHIWGEQYKRDLGSTKEIELQEEIAQSVAGRICGLFGAVF
ncbi:MAG: hypothetical protein AB9866_30525 [Syntrophobacteraceae bacterium]